MERIKNPKQAIEVLKEHLDINLSTDKLIIGFAEYIQYRHQLRSMIWNLITLRVGLGKLNLWLVMVMPRDI